MKSRLRCNVSTKSRMFVLAVDRWLLLISIGGPDRRFNVRLSEAAREQFSTSAARVCPSQTCQVSKNSPHRRNPARSSSLSADRVQIQTWIAQSVSSIEIIHEPVYYLKLWHDQLSNLVELWIEVWWSSESERSGPRVQHGKRLETGPTCTCVSSRPYESDVLQF